MCHIWLVWHENLLNVELHHQQKKMQQRANLLKITINLTTKETMDITNAQITILPVDKLENNKGQINGVPKKPRTISRAKLDALCTRLQNNNLTGINPLKVYEQNGKYIVLGGNQRLKALKKMMIQQVACIIVPKNTNPDILRQIVMLDNESDGKDNWALLDEEWDFAELQTWGIEKPKKRFGNNIFNESATIRNKYGLKHRIYGGFGYCFEKDSVGTLSEIKTPANIQWFADCACKLLCDMCKIHNTNDWCIITPPARRHKEWHFATEIAQIIATKIGLKFYPNCIQAKSRKRIGGELELLQEIAENNIILYDDIITTGSTIKATKALFLTKNIITIIGVDNS